jgi:hypothetical protein
VGLLRVKSEQQGARKLKHSRQHCRKILALSNPATVDAAVSRVARLQSWLHVTNNSCSQLRKGRQAMKCPSAGGRRFMARKFSSQIMSLGQLLAPPHMFKTPPFQRSFVWTPEEAATLVEEITTAFEAMDGETLGDGCFLGTMLFMNADRSSTKLRNWALSRSQKVLEIVDGLQRLTTVTILLCLLRDLELEEGRKPSEKLRSSIIAGRGPKATSRVALRGPDEDFLNSLVRKDAIHGEPDTEALSISQANLLEVRDYLRGVVAEYTSSERRQLIEFLLDDCCVDVLATTGIDRAHRMFTVLNTAGKPLTCNDILKAKLLSGVPGPRMERLVAMWEKAETQLGDDFEKLFGHIKSMHARTSHDVIAAVSDIAAQVGGGPAFIEHVLHPAAPIFANIRAAHHTGSPHSEAIASSLSYLGWLRGGDWVPAVLLWWLEKETDPAAQQQFLGAIERLAYALHIQKRSPKRRNGRMSAVMYAIRQGQDLFSAPSPLELGQDETHTLHYNLRDIHKRDPKIAKLVLMRVNDAIAGCRHNLDSKSLTVEHILPRRPGAPWRALFPDPVERDRLTSSLGNLVLVPRSLNGKAGNQEFHLKKRVLFGKGFDLPINDFVRRQEEWTAAQIEAREAELLRLLDQIWRIGPSSGSRAAAQVSTPLAAKRRRASERA